MIKNVSIGADPEFFLFDIERGIHISSEGLIGGSKDEPVPIGNGCFLQEDNVSVEFNIPPCKSANKMIESIEYCKKAALGFAKSTCIVSDKSSVYFEPEFLNTRQAQFFGCSRDMNVYTMEINDPPNASNTYLRTSGGHIHVGYDNPDDETGTLLVKAMDLYLGVPSVLMDKDKDRKQLYGKAGAFRFYHYGIEYRVLSNFWIMSPEMIRWIFNSTMRAVKFVNSGDLILNQDEIASCINNSDEILAKSIVNKYKLFIYENA